MTFITLGIVTLQKSYTVRIYQSSLKRSYSKRISEIRSWSRRTDGSRGYLKHRGAFPRYRLFTNSASYLPGIRGELLVCWGRLGFSALAILSNWMTLRGQFRAYIRTALIYCLKSELRMEGVQKWLEAIIFPFFQTILLFTEVMKNWGVHKDVHTRKNIYIKISIMKVVEADIEKLENTGIKVSRIFLSHLLFCEYTWRYTPEFHDCPLFFFPPTGPLSSSLCLHHCLQQISSVHLNHPAFAVLPSCQLDSGAHFESPGKTVSLILVPVTVLLWPGTTIMSPYFFLPLLPGTCSVTLCAWYIHHLVTHRSCEVMEHGHWIWAL